MIGLHATDGAEMAVKYINAELGGVDGHPVQLDTCFIASAEEEGTGCAQKFLANKTVNVIAMGGAVIGVQSFYATLGGQLPVVGGVAALPIDGAQKNTAVLFGDATSVLGPMGTYGKDVLHAKTAVVLYPNTASDTPGALVDRGGAQVGRHLGEDGPVLAEHHRPDRRARVDRGRLGRHGRPGRRRPATA